MSPLLLKSVNAAVIVAATIILVARYWEPLARFLSIIAWPLRWVGRQIRRFVLHPIYRFVVDPLWRLWVRVAWKPWVRFGWTPLEDRLPGAKYLPLSFEHLTRNWIRTASTVVAMSVCIFLFCTLRSVLA